MFEILQYSFIIRGLEAGLLVGMLAPFVGIFLVLRRYSLIADTLSHVSLAGVALGLFLKIDPLLTALGASALSSLVIERLRSNKKMYSETALSLFLSGSLACAIILLGLAHGFSVDLFSYLFGSIATVQESEVVKIFLMSIGIALLLAVFFKELVFISFDEEAALVSGIPVGALNALFMVLAAATIALSMPVIGILLVSALLVIPVVTAFQFKKSFLKTLAIAEICSLSAVISGMVMSFYFNVSSGGTIVLTLLAIFCTSLFVQRVRHMCC